MIKLALIGDSAARHYTVADRLWELISVVANKKFTFDVIPAASPNEVIAVFEAFRADRSFVGFNISPPWQTVLATRLETHEKLIDLPILNAVYKDSSGRVAGVNTEPLATQLALEANINVYTCKSVLVIGTEGSGVPIAHHFLHNLGKQTYLYDPSYEQSRAEEGIVYLSSLLDVAECHYDVIINTTPLGRYYFDKRLEAFTSPLDLEILDRISHKGTVVQETNYLPSNTLLLQMARHLDLRVVTGERTLVFTAIESLRRYFGITLDENTVTMLVSEIGAYIAEREIDILDASG